MCPLQAYVYVTVDYSTKRNHLSRITIFDRIVQEGSSAFIKEPNLQIKWPFALNDQGTSRFSCHASLSEDLHLQLAGSSFMHREGLARDGVQRDSGMAEGAHIGVAPVRPTLFPWIPNAQ